MAGLGAGLAVRGSSDGRKPVLASRTLVPISQQTNPLESYPNRDWEDVYRGQYSYDSSFTWVCSPNDTHECRLRAFVKNGIVLRSEQNYDSGNITDIYGNQATPAWNPRACSKGFTMHRRVLRPEVPPDPQGVESMGRRRIPLALGRPRAQDTYKFNSRGTDTFLRASWDEVTDYVATVAKATAENYSGADGKRRLEADGYQPEMIAETHGAGTRTMKLRGEA